MSAELTARSTGRWYPVVVEFTEHRLIMVEASSQDAAVRAVEGDGCLYEVWEGADKLEVWSGIEVSDGYIARRLLNDGGHDSPIGPPEACSECGAVARDFGAGVYEHSLAGADHLSSCASFIHRVDRKSAHASDGELLGFFLRCTCEAPGLENTWQREPLPNGSHYRTVEHFPGRTVYPGTPEGKAAIAEAARAHVAGLPHSKNVTLDVIHDIRHTDLRRRGLVTA